MCFKIESLRVGSDVVCAVIAAVDQQQFNMDTNMEKDCAILEEFFQQIILDMKVIVDVNNDFAV